MHCITKHHITCTDVTAALRNWTASTSFNQLQQPNSTAKAIHLRTLAPSISNMAESYQIGTRSECERLVRDWGFRSAFTWADGR